VWWCHGVEHGPLRPEGWVTPTNWNTPEARQQRTESGEQTPHLQCAFQTSHDIAWSKAIEWLNEKCTDATRDGGAWHVEPAQGGLEDQRSYCSKEGTFFESGEPEEFERARRSEQGKRSDFEDIKNKIQEGASIDDLREEYFATFAQHERYFTAYKGIYDEKNFKERKLTNYDNIVWKPWQGSILEIAMGPVQNRKVHVIVDPAGNSGKSFLSNYMALRLNFLILNPSSKRDMAYIFTQAIHSGMNVSGVVIDIARSIVGSGMNEHLPNTALAAVYNFVECMHDERITNTKYESKTVWFPQPHVFIFTNHAVERNEFTLSADRWNVMNLRANVLMDTCRYFD
jgi:hypothetical protein